MVAYLRIDGLDPEDFDQTHHHLFNDLANGVFAHIRDDHPDLYEDLEGIIPVRNVEHDPRLLETTAVYAHRDATVDDGVSDFIFCSFENDVEHLDVRGYTSVHEYPEVRLVQRFDGDREALDDILPTESERDANDGNPARVGTLYHDGERVVRVTFEQLEEVVPDA
jgi:hypothetical protein